MPTTMLVVRAVAAFTVGAMSAVILAALTTSSLAEDGASLLALAWGRVSLVDLYLAFVLMWLWIVFRERSAWRSALWLVVTLVTGSLAIGVYLLAASMRARTPLELVLGPARWAELRQDTTAG